MSNQIIGTPQQSAQFDQVLEELKSVPGPVMKAMQRAQDIYGYLPIEVQSKIAATFGVPLEEVCGETMESRLTPGLFLAGELLDVDGMCGGYNLQWAWATGWLSGNSAAEAAEKREDKRRDGRRP